MHRIGLALLFALTTAVPGGTQQKNTPSTSQGGVYPSRAQLVGTWKLISRAVKLEDDTAVEDHGIGSAPKGYLMCDSSGHMAVQLMRADRPLAIDCGTSSSAASDNSPEILSGYEAYFVRTLWTKPTILLPTILKALLQQHGSARDLFRVCNPGASHISSRIRDSELSFRR